MTSAINGRIVFKQGPRNYLEANIRRNSLVFDTDNNTILYSPSGTSYYEFFPGQGGGVSGTVYWNDIIGEPIASNSTSGLLSVSDWNTFNNKVDLSALSGIGSGNGSVSSVGISSNTLVVFNSPITTSGTFSVNLSSVTTSGIFTKVSYDNFGRIISGSNLVSADIPTLPTNKIQTDSNNRFVSDAQINSWTSSVVSAHTHSNKSTLDNINQNLNTSASVLFSSISSTNYNDTNFSGNMTLVSDSSRNIIESNITLSQLNYLSGTSANIQNQINTKPTVETLSNNDIIFGGSVISKGVKNKNIAPRRGLGTYWLSNAELTPGKTGVVRLQAPNNAIGVYLNFQTYSSAAGDISKAGILPIAAVGDDTGTSTYKPVTFSNGQISGTIPGWIPGNYPPNDKNFAQTLRSDYIGFKSVNRTDFPTRGPLLDVAFKVGPRSIYAGSYDPVNSNYTPWVVGWTNTDTDILTTPSTQTMYPYMATHVWAEWVYAGARKPVIGAWGDSIFDGMSSSAVQNGYIQNACYGNDIELFSNSIGGRTSFDTFDVLRLELPKMVSKLDAVMIAAWSPNDQINGYSTSSVWNRFLIEKDWIESLGLQCLVMGPIPYTGTTSPGTIRNNLIDAGIDFFDGGVVVATSTNLLNWISGYSQDNIHPNVLGHNMLSYSLYPWLSSRISTQKSASELAGILYETNAGYQGLTATVETQFATYTIDRFDCVGDFFTKRRMIKEEFMSGVNFTAPTARLTLNEYWNGVLVQQTYVNPQMSGVQGYGSGQNKCLDVNTQMRVEGGVLSACNLRGHMSYSSSFNGASIWGDKNEFSYGQISIDITNGINVVWKYQWNSAGNTFYFDHLKVTW